MFAFETLVVVAMNKIDLAAFVELGKQKSTELTDRGCAVRVGAMDEKREGQHDVQKRRRAA